MLFGDDLNIQLCCIFSCRFHTLSTMSLALCLVVVSGAPAAGVSLHLILDRQAVDAPMQRVDNDVYGVACESRTYIDE